jgi:AraC family transcriptional regulator, arabinose operon regulatory protein
MLNKKEGFQGQRSCILQPAILEEVRHHPLCRQLYITDIGYYPRAEFHLRKRKKGSREHIFIYCVQGSGWYQIQDQTYTISPNQAFILPANTPHQYGADPEKPWTIYWFHFTGEQAPIFRNYLCDQENSFAPFTLHPDHDRIKLFEDIFDHLTMAFNQDNLVYANNCLHHFLATLKPSVYKPQPSGSLEDLDCIEAAILFMKNNLEKNLSLQDIVDEIGMSASHFSALFKKRMKNSPINFFAYLRIQKACELLENSSLQIKEVAHLTGFSDPYHFSRVFSHQIGFSPKKFRMLEKA